MAHHDEVTDLMAENAMLREAIDATWRKLIEFPYAQVCKHYAVVTLGTELEKRGVPMIDGLVKAIVSADDATALSYPTIFGKE